MNTEENFSNTTQNIRVKLSDMINAGKNPFEIILELAKFLGEVSGEETYYQNISDQISAIYGFALHDKFVLERELAEVSARLEKIEAAKKNPDFTEEERKRMGYAIERHKSEIERLKNLKDAKN